MDCFVVTCRMLRPATDKPMIKCMEIHEADQTKESCQYFKLEPSNLFEQEFLNVFFEYYRIMYHTPMMGAIDMTIFSSLIS